ncbi:MAG: hypothetical protein ABSD20_16480, partial [Terriglobales bacterium]
MKKKIKKSHKQGNSDAIPPPSSPGFTRLAMERTLRDVHRLMEAQKFNSIEEANAFLANLSGPVLEQALTEALPQSPQQEAQDIAARAMEAATKRDAIALARQALDKDPDC